MCIFVPDLVSPVEGLRVKKHIEQTLQSLFIGTADKRNGVSYVYLLHVNLENLQSLRKISQLNAYVGYIVSLQYEPAWANWLLILKTVFQNLHVG